MITDERATLQLRIWINKFLKNKDNFNTTLARLITEYSHSTTLTPNMYFLCGRRCYVVEKLLSPFWCVAREMPMQLYFHSHRPFYLPDWRKAGDPEKKRIFSAFDNPYLKRRSFIFREKLW